MPPFARIKGDARPRVVGGERAVRAAAVCSDSTRGLSRRRSQELQERRDALTGALRRHLPTWSRRRPRSGLSFWVRIPASSSEAFAQHALRHEVAVTPPSALTLSPSDDHRDRLRLSFAGPPEELAEGVRQLAGAWAARA